MEVAATHGSTQDTPSLPASEEKPNAGIFQKTRADKEIQETEGISAISLSAFNNTLLPSINE